MSSSWHDRALQVIPLGSNTLSKQSLRWPGGPSFLESAAGAYVTDTEGNEWLDWSCSLGPGILGYAHPEVTLAMAAQLRNPVLPLCHPLEVEVAERITQMCPGVEAVRLGKTGSDAVAAAVRCARAFTGRDLALVDGNYHGWHDWCSEGPGIPPQRTGIFRGHGDLYDAACLVVEPDRFSSTELRVLRDRCSASGTLLIFDEVVCGFRIAPGGARELFGVHPDLSCYGKSIANGMAVSAVGGSWEVMSTFNAGFWSTTHGGETLSLAAARTTMDLLRDGSVIAEIRDRGQRLRSDLLKLGAPVWGDPSHLVWSFESPTHQEHVQRGFASEGILTNGHFFGMDPHTDDDLDRTLAAAKRCV